jgi:uncharacterized protein (DUF849 family)
MEHDWEVPHLPTEDGIFRNTFRDIRYIREPGQTYGTIEFECYDIGHLYNLAYFVKSPGQASVRVRYIAATGSRPLAL